jgi:hypothetical protein
VSKHESAVETVDCCAQDCSDDRYSRNSSEQHCAIAVGQCIAAQSHLRDDTHPTHALYCVRT